MTGQATPANARHGAWKLTLGSEVDRRIREHLARGRSVAQIAEGVGVAVGYVEALIRDESGADAPPRSVLRAELPVVETPTALARVPCIVAGAEIGARDCVDRQCRQRCFCPKASYAINAVASHALPGTRLDEQLIQCRAVARSVLLKPDLEDRFLGPALRVFRGEKVEEELIAGELPAPPARPVVVAPAAPMSARAPKHAQPSREKPPEPPAAPAPRPGAAEVAAAVLAQRASPRPARQDPELAGPPEEEPMPLKKTNPCRWTEEKCDEKIAENNESGFCGRHFNIVKMRKRREAEREVNPPTQTTRPRKPIPHAESVPAAPADLALEIPADIGGPDKANGLLEAMILARRRVLLNEIARIDKALAVLRE